MPDTIRAEGVPPIPASVRQALNRYQNIRSASFQDWASDGSGMYVITRFADVPQVHFVATPGGARTQLTFLNERVLSVSARPKHDQFLYMADEGGAENYQLFLQDRKGGEARRITDGKSRNMAPKWSPSGELLAWSSNARNGRDMDLYVASPLDPHFVRRFKEVSGQWTVSDWSPDETKVVAVEYISINESYIHIIEVATGKTETITPRPSDPQGRARLRRRRRNGRRTGNRSTTSPTEGSEFRRLVRHDLGSGTVDALTSNVPWDIEEFDLSDDGQLIACGGEREDGQSDPYSIESELRLPQQTARRRRHAEISTDRHMGGTRPVEAANSQMPVRSRLSASTFRPGRIEVGVHAQPRPDAIRCYSSDRPGTVDDRIVARWTSSETGGLDPDTFAEPEPIEYPSRSTAARSRPSSTAPRRGSSPARGRS